MLSIKAIARKRSMPLLILSMAVGFLIPYIYLQIIDITETYCDAWVYSEHAKPFVESGLFNLSAYAERYGASFRGFLLPWLIALGQVLSRVIPFVDYRFLISVFASVICVVALPAVMEHVFEVKFDWWKRPLLLVPLIYFFHGTLEYPLSDLWAAGFAVIAVWSLIRATDVNELNPIKRFAWAAGMGAALAAAYNIRTINLLIIISLSICMLVLIIRRKEVSIAHRLMLIPMAAVGFILVSLPQMLINLQCYQSPSPLIISEGGSGLFINQLYDGIYQSKYETYVGYEYEMEGMVYYDRAGLAILDEMGFAHTDEFGTGAETLGGVGDYIKLVLSYPLDFLGIYARHLVNMLDIRHPEVFVEDICASRLTPILNYLLLYCSFATLALELRHKRKGLGRLWLLFALLLPSFGILAGAIESRFSIVLMLTLWASMLALIRKELFTGLHARSWLALDAGLIVFFVVMTTVAGEMMASLADMPTLY